MLQKFMVFIPDASSSTQGRANVEGTIVTLARLYAFIVTAPACLREVGTDRAGAHRQKLSHETFSVFVPVAYNQVVCMSKSFVDTWCPANLSVD